MNNKGMSTIEAVIIIPVCFSIIMLLIWTGIFFYNKNVLSQAASRAAICGSQKSYYENNEIADYVTDSVLKITDGKLILLDEADVSVTVSSTQISVNVTGTMSIPGFLILGNVYDSNMWNIDITEYAARLKNPMVVRTVNRIEHSL
jgi:Flp pilus assembly protein TadG